MQQWQLIVGIGCIVCLLLGIFLFSNLSSFSSASEQCLQQGGVCLPDCQAAEMQAYHSLSCSVGEECCMRF